MASNWEDCTPQNVTWKMTRKFRLHVPAFYHYKWRSKLNAQINIQSMIFFVWNKFLSAFCQLAILIYTYFSIFRFSTCFITLLTAHVVFIYRFLCLSFQRSPWYIFDHKTIVFLLTHLTAGFVLSHRRVAPGCDFIAVVLLLCNWRQTQLHENGLFSRCYLLKLVLLFH